MNAQNDSTAPSSTTTWRALGGRPRFGMQRIIAPWEYRDLRGWARARTAAGTVLVGLGAITLFAVGPSRRRLPGWAGAVPGGGGASLAPSAWELAIARFRISPDLSLRAAMVRPRRCAREWTSTHVGESQPPVIPWSG